MYLNSKFDSPSLNLVFTLFIFPPLMMYNLTFQWPLPVPIIFALGIRTYSIWKEPQQTIRFNSFVVKLS